MKKILIMILMFALSFVIFGCNNTSTEITEVYYNQEQVDSMLEELRVEYDNSYILLEKDFLEDIDIFLIYRDGKLSEIKKYNSNNLIEETFYRTSYYDENFNPKEEYYFHHSDKCSCGLYPINSYTNFYEDEILKTQIQYYNNEIITISNYNNDYFTFEDSGYVLVEIYQNNELIYYLYKVYIDGFLTRIKYNSENVAICFYKQLQPGGYRWANAYESYIYHENYENDLTSITVYKTSDESSLNANTEIVIFEGNQVPQDILIPDYDD